MQPISNKLHLLVFFWVQCSFLWHWNSGTWSLGSCNNGWGVRGCPATKAQWLRDIFVAQLELPWLTQASVAFVYRTTVGNHTISFYFTPGRSEIPLPQKCRAIWSPSPAGLLPPTEAPRTMDSLYIRKIQSLPIFLSVLYKDNVRTGQTSCKQVLCLVPTLPRPNATTERGIRWNE